MAREHGCAGADSSETDKDSDDDPEPHIASVSAPLSFRPAHPGVAVTATAECRREEEEEECMWLRCSAVLPASHLLD